MTRKNSHCQIVKVKIILSIRKGLYVNLDRQESNITSLSIIQKNANQSAWAHPCSLSLSFKLRSQKYVCHMCSPCAFGSVYKQGYGISRERCWNPRTSAPSCHTGRHTPPSRSQSSTWPKIKKAKDELTTKNLKLKFSHQLRMPEAVLWKTQSLHHHQLPGWTLQESLAWW